MRQQLRRNLSSLFNRAFLLVAALVAAPLVAQAQSSFLQIRTLAGLTSLGYVDATGTNARFNGPASVAVDSAGNVFVADGFNHVIRKVTPAGVVSTFAGNGSFGSADGTGTAARFAQVYGVAIDGTDTLYVADSGNNTIRKITPAGVVTTLAGLAGNGGSTDGTGSAARFSFPRGIAVDAAGANVYVADSGNSTIRKVTSAGVVTTLAGSPGLSGGTDGTGSAARFRFPGALAVDASGTVFVADSINHTIRQVTSGGVVTTLAGTAGGFGFADGTGSAARFAGPNGIAVDGAGNLYVGDTGNNNIRQIAPGAVVTTIAGSLQIGVRDGTGTAARFFNPGGVALASGGTLFVADGGNNLVRKITAGAVVTTVAGYNGSVGSTDATGRGARFFNPQGVAVGPGNNVFVADYWNFTIRKITPWGQTSTIAGLAGSLGSTDGVGSAARFSFPAGLAVDNAGVIYVANSGGHTIRQIATDGTVTTLAGLAGPPGSADGTGSDARFKLPSGVAVDGAGTLYIADTGNNTIRKITAGGVVTTLAGLAGSPGYLDGTGSAARFSAPMAVAVDAAGANIYVADSVNHSIRQITSAGVVTTLAGIGPSGGAGEVDGTGSAARFAGPQGIALDGIGNLFVVDNASSVIRKIAPGAVVTTVAGNPFNIGAHDGSNSTFNNPVAVAVDSHGAIYVADARNNAIRTSAPIRYDGGDFDNDGKSDLTIYRPGSGTWYVSTSGSGYTQSAAINWGLGGDIPVPGDYDGDGVLDFAIFRPSTGTWWVLTSTSDYKSYRSYNFGTTGDIPFALDADGDRIVDLIVFRPSTGQWWYTASMTGYSQYGNFTWGTPGDIPFLGDYDGDGGADPTIYRPSTGEWWIADSSGPNRRFLWGTTGDIPVSRDFDGDGLLDLAIYRPSTGEWWVLTSSSNFTSYKRYLWGGVSGDVPVAADYDGDGIADVAVYRPATGEWWVLTSSSNFTAYTRYLWGGVNGDIPVVGR
jgi:DNA-binding beta-propeller fold protein YncE